MCGYFIMKANECTFINISSFATLFIKILPSYYRFATGIGRWDSML